MSVIGGTYIVFPMYRAAPPDALALVLVGLGVVMAFPPVWSLF